MNNKKAIFLDLFGTLIEDHGQMESIDDIRFKRQSIDALKKLQDKGFIAFISVCRVNMPIPDREYLKKVQNFVKEKLLINDIKENIIHFISHVQPQRVELHPLTLDVIRSLKNEYKLNLSGCVLVGDMIKDIKIGKQAGIKTALISSPIDTPLDVDDDWIEPDIIGANLLEVAEQLINS